MFAKIVKTDFVACVSFVVPTSTVVIYALLLLAGDVKPESPGFVGFTLTLAIMALLALSVLVWRVKVIAAVLDGGVEVPATVERVAFRRGQGRIDYRYQHRGQEYESGAYLIAVAEARAIRSGDRIVVMVDRINPKRAFIRDLYIRRKSSQPKRSGR